MSRAVIPRYRFDDLRRFAAGLGTAAGLSPPRAWALVSHLLWFDGAGAAALGIATLPDWLAAIETGRVNAGAVGRVTGERSALALLDGEHGIPHLILERAAELAVEKARETAVGLVRVRHLGAVRSAAAVVAGIALGPMAGWVLGPNRLWGMALPCDTGLPVVIDSGLAAAAGTGKPGARAPGSPTDATQPAAVRRDAAGLLEGLGLAAAVLLPEDGWLVAAVSVPVLEPLATFHQRVAAALAGLAPAPGRLLPDSWDAHRRAARQYGIALAAPARQALHHWAQRLAVELPEPISAGG